MPHVDLDLAFRFIEPIQFWTDGKKTWQCEKRINQFPLKIVTTFLNVRRHDDLLYLWMYKKQKMVDIFVNLSRGFYLTRG